MFSSTLLLLVSISPAPDTLRDVLALLIDSLMLGPPAVKTFSSTVSSTFLGSTSSAPDTLRDVLLTDFFLASASALLLAATTTSAAVRIFIFIAGLLLQPRGWSLFVQDGLLCLREHVFG
eukprot:CAMPEP_0178987402 /NCGR_PEP_ID=MMETSP0795-20121207/3247_1 /TAXON_ID=88552 /ORGANISM="Amoebophrya sp., Strain Ameob2" /LENGTH=119 /DNA_ID=CAMNT_0020678585 /DNA_START=329 /DNA_END=685 /DNA_ORIENTATION=-